MREMFDFTRLALLVSAPDPGKWFTCKIQLDIIVRQATNSICVCRRGLHYIYESDSYSGSYSGRLKAVRSISSGNTVLLRRTVADLLMWFKVCCVSTKNDERMNMRPQDTPVGHGISCFETNPLEHVEHVLQISSFQLKKTSTTKTHL